MYLFRSTPKETDENACQDYSGFVASVAKTVQEKLESTIQAKIQTVVKTSIEKSIKEALELTTSKMQQILTSGLADQLQTAIAAANDPLKNTINSLRTKTSNFEIKITEISTNLEQQTVTVQRNSANIVQLGSTQKAYFQRLQNLEMALQKSTPNKQTIE